jgi:hypothetical protein
VVCDEYGIGGSGENFGDNDVHLGRISMLFSHEAFGGKYAPHVLLFDLKPGVIGAVTLSRRSNSNSN